MVLTCAGLMFAGPAVVASLGVVAAANATLSTGIAATILGVGGTIGGYIGYST